MCPARKEGEAANGVLDLALHPLCAKALSIFRS